MLTDNIKEQRSGTVSPPVGSVRSLASGRYQARYFDPDTRRMVPAPQTFATKGAADRWLAVKRTELDAGTAVDEKTGNRPLREWWPGYWRSTQKALTLVGTRPVAPGRVDDDLPCIYPAMGDRSISMVSHSSLFWRRLLIVAAVGQLVSPTLIFLSSSDALTSDATATPITPPGWAFAMWGVICTASIVYAIYRRPTRTRNSLEALFDRLARHWLGPWYRTRKDPLIAARN